MSVELESLDEKLPATATATATTVFLFFEHMHNIRSIAHSFYAVEIPKVLPPTRPARKSLSLVLEFRDDKYPRGMRCAKLGSKFYFLGGKRHGLHPVERVEFPSDVYLFDPSPISFSDSHPPPPPPPSDQLLQAVPPMTTGKPNPCVFVADGKLYVLGSTFRDTPKLWKLNLSIKFFEVFDPSTSKWTVLSNPPLDMVDRPTTWFGSTVVGRKVFIVGKPCVSTAGRYPIQLTFDLDSHSWVTVLPEKVTFQFPSSAELVENDTLYGGDETVLAKLGPFTQEEAEDEEKLFRHPLFLMDTDILRPYTFRFSGYMTSRSLCHIGNRCFCYAEYAWPWGYDNGFFHAVIVIIFQDTSKTEASFNVKYLYSDLYELETSISYEGKILGCFALTPEDKEKLMKKLRKKEKRKVHRDREKGVREDQDDKKSYILSP